MGKKTSRIQSFVPEAFRYVSLTVLPLTLYASEGKYNLSMAGWDHAMCTGSEEAVRLSRVALVCARVSTRTIRIRVIEVSGTQGSVYDSMNLHLKCRRQVMCTGV